MENLNSFKVLGLLLKHLGVPVTRTGIITEFQKHSDAASLLAFSDLLDRWDVPNAAYQVSITELVETELPLPFIACFRKSEFVLVTQKNAKEFVVSNDRWNDHVLTIDEFEKQYQGSILAVEKDASSGEPDYSVKRRKEIIEHLRIPFVIVGTLIIIFVHLLINHSYITTFNWHVGLLTVFKISGLTASILLLIQSIDANNPLIKKVCGSDSNKNCNAILSSNAAKVIDGLSWSEIGYFYFAGTLLALFFNSSNDSVMRFLAILNIFSLPYTFYSIYYQWRIAKQWCIFCCSVQVVLWLECFALFTYLFKSNQFPDLNAFGTLFICFLMPILLWVFVKPHLINSTQLQILKPELYKYKYNKQLFQRMLDQEHKYALLSENSSIIIGNKAANHVLTLVSNPFCVHCSKTHQLLDDLLDMRDDIKLQLVFVNRRYKKDIDQKVIRHFMALKSDNNENRLKKAINDWYKQEKKIYELWSGSYPATGTETESDTLLKQQEWSNMVNITSTPTIFINGRRLPLVYQPDDIKYIL